MRAADGTILTLAGAPGPASPRLAEPGRFVCPEQFQAMVEAEAGRHARHLHGFGVLRISPRHGRMGAGALREALETETRRTDAVCAYPDGSAAVLVVHADAEALEALAHRLEEVAREIAVERGAPSPDYASGAAVTEGRRAGAHELWARADAALESARETSTQLAWARWH